MTDTAHTVTGPISRLGVPRGVGELGWTAPLSESESESEERSYRDRTFGGPKKVTWLLETREHITTRGSKLVFVNFFLFFLM